MTNAVLTAGPSAGKSSLLRELSARGYQTVPEAARIITDQKISEGVPKGEVKERLDFPKECLKKDRELESNLPSGDVFLDRSLADSLAYCDLYGYDYDDHDELWAKGAYDIVFLLERIEYEDDYARDENESEAQHIHQRLIDKYEAFGYDLIEVPLMAVDKRADYVEEHLVDKQAYKGTIH